MLLTYFLLMTQIADLILRCSWLPTKDDRKGTYMVVGDPINPRNFITERHFIEKYATSVEDLFNRHKMRFPTYKDRELQWVKTKREVSREKEIQEKSKLQRGKKKKATKMGQTKKRRDSQTSHGTIKK